MTEKEIFEKLSAPFTKTVNGKTMAAHKWLPGSKAGNDKMICMAYVDRELVINRLNEVMGLTGWQFEPRLETDGTKTGTLSLLIGGEWITRADTGTKSNQEGEKGATSDALKRAATHFGVGTYIYSLPKYFISAKPGKNGKLQPVDKNGRALYGDNLHNYINGMSSGQGLLMQLYNNKPEMWQTDERKQLFNKLWSEIK